LGTEHECCGERASVVNAACGYELDGLSSEWRLVLLADICACWRQYRCGDIASVTSCFAALSAYDVGANGAGFVDVFGVTCFVSVCTTGKL